MRILAFLLLCCALQAHAQWPSNQTPTYHEAIDAFRSLANENPKTMRFLEAGPTDSGHPLSILVIDGLGDFNPSAIHSDARLVCMVMNAIHAGEACGVNASFEFAQAKAADPGDVVYVIIPVYNIGGALQRNSTTRANQNGPETYGFRGNARNLDLNRDFIKADSKNSLSFAELYHTWKPHIFIDTHTSNGADYPAAMTLISTFPEKLHPLQASILERDLLPALYRGMKERGNPMVPYVNTIGATPEGGIAAFTDLPRYSTGYVSLFNTLGFTTEAHMFKSFDKRVEATRTFFETMDATLRTQGDMIVKMKAVADKEAATAKSFTTGWRVSREIDSLLFAGYRADSVKSVVTGQLRLRYDRSKPYEEKIPYYRYHEKARDTKLPEYYVVPVGWDNVAERLDANQIEYRIIQNDTTIDVQSTIIEDYKTFSRPYEGHYPHYEISTRPRRESVAFSKGSLLVRTDQPGNRYLAHVFNPENEDSFFAWNFFDAYLTQKEYFSDYVFEETAAELLKRNSQLRKAFEEKRASDPSFAEDAQAQLDFIYQNSPHKEPVHLRVPIFEILK